MRKSLYLAGALVLALTGCGQHNTSSTDTVAVKTEGAATAAVAADMCAEHGVLEALCTKCHPKLIAIFKAKGDWCAEHGFPESICPIHHPERGGRPATDVAVDQRFAGSRVHEVVEHVDEAGRWRQRRRRWRKRRCRRRSS